MEEGESRCRERQSVAKDGDKEQQERPGAKARVGAVVADPDIPSRQRARIEFDP